MPVMSARLRCDMPRRVRLAIGLVLDIAGTLFVSNCNPSDNIEASASSVFGHIVGQNELVPVSQDYSIVDKQGDSSPFFCPFDIPFIDNSFWYRYGERSRRASTSRLPRLTPKLTPKETT